MQIAARQKLRRGIAFFMFLMFPVVLNYLSPYLIIMGASEGIISGSMIMFGIMFLSSLFFGRAFCGWVCPASGMQESTQRFRTKKAKTGAGNIVRWIIWILWLGIIAMVFIKAGGMTKADFLYNSPGFISLLQPNMVFIYLIVILLVFAMTMIWGQRAFCKYICWMAPFMIIGDRIRRWLKIPGIYLKEDKSKCIECGRCTKECPMDIDVKNMVQKENIYSTECIMCLNCADVCPKNAINVGRKV